MFAAGVGQLRWKGNCAISSLSNVCGNIYAFEESLINATPEKCENRGDAGTGVQ